MHQLHAGRTPFYLLNRNAALESAALAVLGTPGLALALYRQGYVLPDLQRTERLDPGKLMKGRWFRRYLSRGGRQGILVDGDELANPLFTARAIQCHRRSLQGLAHDKAHDIEIADFGRSSTIFDGCGPEPGSSGWS
jgi:hypothetical protein